MGLLWLANYQSAMPGQGWIREAFRKVDPRLLKLTSVPR
jgi:hypothetical protein